MFDTTLDKAYEVTAGLVRDFDANKHHYMSSSYSEAQVRHDFIDRFFIALGWDVRHDFQRNPFEQEVKVERNVDIRGSSQRRADYSFSLAPNFRDPKFYLEAKKPFVNVATPENYFQVMRYGWNAGTPFGVITDFEQFHIIDCRYKPNIDTALDCAFRQFHYHDYLDKDKFAELYWLFSREAVADGSIEKRAAELPRKRGAAKQRGLFGGAYQPIDESFLQDIDDYRKRIAKGLKRRNYDLDGLMLTEVTQRIIDRLVFMRFLEDKHIETDISIKQFGSKGSAWNDFKNASRKLDAIYNGIIFKKHEIVDSASLDVDDSDIASIFEEISSLNTPYNFDSIPIHILGSIYERFLGKVIRTTDKRAEVEDKPEVKKAGGVYYTPQYIVRYIVENTVGRLVEGKTPDEIAKLRILDPACGSGSFLIGAYDYLLEYHRRWYNAHKKRIKKGDCVEHEDGTYHLSLNKKREILLNNIYGVDIDTQAVEVAQLSLFLKLLEEETTASARNFQLECRQTILPDLKNNIKCGNSLIGPDFYVGTNGSLFDDEELVRINVFDWNAEFKEIMKSGGFDAVISNPPYGAIFGDKEEGYIAGKYNIYNFIKDIYPCFVIKASSFLNNTGILSFIVPSAWLGGPSYKLLREFLLKKALLNIILLPFDVFKDAYIDTCIFVLKNNRPSVTHNVYTFTYNKKDKINAINVDKRNYNAIQQSKWISIEDNKMILDCGAIRIIEKLRQENLRNLGDAIELKRGVLLDREHLSGKKQSDLSYLYFEGDIYRYNMNMKADKWVIFDDNLKERPKDVKWFTNNRLLLRRLVNRRHRLMASYATKPFITNKNLYSILEKHGEYDLKVILGILNSKLISYIYINQVTQAVKDDFPQVTIKDVAELPFPRNLSGKDCSKLVKLVDEMLSLNKKLAPAKTEREKNILERQITHTDAEIDKLVYSLYGLTEDEIKIVEESGNPK